MVVSMVVERNAPANKQNATCVMMTDFTQVVQEERRQISRSLLYTWGCSLTCFLKRANRTFN
jgi:hypothetical protein